MCNFSVDYVRWCGMHTLNLGLVQTMLGSTIRVLLDSKQWGDVTDELQLKAGFLEFVSWARQHKIPHLPASSIFSMGVSKPIYIFSALSVTNSGQGIAIPISASTQWITIQFSSARPTTKLGSELRSLHVSTYIYIHTDIYICICYIFCRPWYMHA